MNSRRDFLRQTGGVLGVAAGGRLLALLEACGQSPRTPPRRPSVSVPSPPDARGTLKVWGFNGTDPLNVTAKSRFDAFKSSFPNVSVELTPGAVDPQRFISAAATGSPPDLLYVGRPEITSYATRSALQVLDPYVEGA